MWEMQGRDQRTSLVMCSGALTLGMCSPTGPQNMHPGGNMFLVSANTWLCGVPCPAAQGGHSKPPSRTGQWCSLGRPSRALHASFPTLTHKQECPWRCATC